MTATMQRRTIRFFKFDTPSVSPYHSGTSQADLSARMLEFRRYSHVFAPYASHRRAERICGPSIAVTGWIPFGPFWVDSAPPDATWREALGYKLMFQSGNPEPPRHASRQDFLRFLKKKEFRGALALDNVSALLNEDGVLIGVEFDHFGMVGYTPLRVAPRTPRILLEGYGDGNFAVALHPQQSVSIEFWHSFKMSKFVDLTNSMITGARATSATAQVIYTFFSDKSVQIQIDGSAIPSQSITLDWRDLVLAYDMKEASYEQANEFFNAGECNTAPVEVHYISQAMGRREPCPQN